MKRDLFDKIFSDSKKNKKVFCFETYNSNSFYCGYVLSFNVEIAQIQHYTKYGKDDGILNIRYSDIKHVTTDSDYIRCMQYLIENHQLLDTNKEIALALQSSSNWLSQIFNEYINDETVIIGIEINNDDWYWGFVKEIDEQFILFSEIDNEGIKCDTGIYKLEDITSIRINDISGRKNLLLYNWKISQDKKIIN